MFAKAGDRVKVDYIALLEGRAVATSMESYARDSGIYREGASYAPLVFSIGSGSVMPGFEMAVIGLQQGEEKMATVHPDGAYGMRRDSFVREYPRELFEHNGISLEKGMILKINTAKGSLRGAVSALDENNILLDLNHEFAGKMLVFRIILREILN
ncbi:MAG: FKBP-type peptidyl-prolyl cis-trans isomerase [Nanoarchaeota archaeon]|nr:FKBP-type peptidyl-prolyl cis-trans isomerase [Nanoarchaeota archaeon]